MFVEKINVNKYFVCLFLTSCLVRIVLYSAVQSVVARSRGISLFKVPTGKNNFDTNWRTRLVAVIKEDRVVDASLRAQIERNNLYICQHHFTEDQYYRHETKVTLNPGVIPSLNLPQKSHPSSSTRTKPRNSAEVIQQKKTFLFNNN